VHEEPLDALEPPAEVGAQVSSKHCWMRAWRPGLQSPSCRQHSPLLVSLAGSVASACALAALSTVQEKLKLTWSPSVSAPLALACSSPGVLQGRAAHDDHERGGQASSLHHQPGEGG